MDHDSIRTRRLRTGLVAAPLAALAIAAAGCGNDDEGDTTTAAEPTRRT